MPDSGVEIRKERTAPFEAPFFRSETAVGTNTAGTKGQRDTEDGREDNGFETRFTEMAGDGVLIDKHLDYTGDGDTKKYVYRGIVERMPDFENQTC